MAVASLAPALASCLLWDARAQHASKVYALPLQCTCCAVTCSTDCRWPLCTLSPHRLTQHRSALAMQDAWEFWPCVMHESEPAVTVSCQVHSGNVCGMAACAQALTEGIHTREALDLVREHVRGIMGQAAMAFSNAMIKMSRLQAAQARLVASLSKLSSCKPPLQAGVTCVWLSINQRGLLPDWHASHSLCGR